MSLFCEFSRSSYDLWDGSQSMCLARAGGLSALTPHSAPPGVPCDWQPRSLSWPRRPPLQLHVPPPFVCLIGPSGCGPIWRWLFADLIR